MKKIALLLIVAVIFPFFMAQAAKRADTQEVTLEWDTVVSNISGYRIYARQGAEYGSEPVWEGLNTTCTIEVPADVDTAFVARAYRVGNISTLIYESENSNEVVVQGKKPQAPNNLIIKAIDQIIQSLIDIKNAISG